MTAVFDRAWQERVANGNSDAIILLTEEVLPRLYDFCFRRLGEKDLTEQAVRASLNRCIREIRDYDTRTYKGDVWTWIVELALSELNKLSSQGDVHRRRTAPTIMGAEEPYVPESRFIYQLQAGLCVAARCQQTDLDSREYEERSQDVAITCPGCGSSFHIGRTRLGRSTRCGQCGTTFEPKSTTSAPGTDARDHRIWFYEVDGEVTGPYAAFELREIISTGQGDPMGRVRHGESGPWQTALHALFDSPPAIGDEDLKSLPVSVAAPPRQPSPRSRRKRLPVSREMPRKVARFEICEWVGSGAFGKVYRAYDPVLDRELALKVATSAALDDDHVRPYILREPKAAAKLRHPNIVAVHDAGFDENQFYMAIDLISGCTLSERLRQGPLNDREAVELVTSLAGALDYAHRSHVLHRDVKPGNVMIDVDGQALLMDFGLARLEHAAGEQSEEGFLGTPGYMPPEQISRDFGEVGGHSDQYSLGVVLFELLCGHPPFSGPQSVLLHNTLYTEPPSPREKTDSIHPDLEAICLKAMAKKPSDRYSTCDQLAQDLHRYQEGRATLARPLKLHERCVRWCRRERALSTALGGCIALVLLFLVFIATTAVMKTRLSNDLAETNETLAVTIKDLDKSNEDLDKTNKELDTAIHDLDNKNKLLEQSLRDTELARNDAIENQAIAFFHHGHTLCDNGQIQQGLVYLGESLRLAVQAAQVDQDQSFVTSIRLSLSAWRRELHGLQARFIHRVAGQDCQVRHLAVDASGTFAVTTTHVTDKLSDVWIWALSGELPTRVEGPIRIDGSVLDLAYAPQSHEFACVVLDNNKTLVRRWKNEDESGWRETIAWRMSDPYRAIAYSPDGSRVLLAGDGIARELMNRDGSYITYTYELPAVGNCVAYSPSGDLVAIGTSDTSDGMGQICVFEAAETMSRRNVWTSQFLDGVVHDVTFSNDGTLLASATGATLKGEARVWNAANGEPVGKPLRHLSHVYAVDFGPENTFILTSSQDRSARLWNHFTGRLMGHPVWHSRDVRDIAFIPRPSGKATAFVSVCDDGIGRVWGVALGTPSKGSFVGPGIFAGAQIGESGKIAVAGVHNLTAGKVKMINTSSLSTSEESGLRFESPVTAIAAGHTRGLVGLRDGRTYVVTHGKSAESFELVGCAHLGTVLCAAISEDEKFGATCGEDGKVCIHEIGGTARNLQHHGKIYVVAFDPSSSAMLTGGVTGEARFYDRKTGEEIGETLHHRDAILCAAYSHNGSMLAVGFGGGAQIWLRAGQDGWKEGARIDAETGILRISPFAKQQIVVTGDLHGDVRFWHAATGKPIGPSLPNKEKVTVLLPADFANGSHVHSCTINGNIRRWPLPMAMTEGIQHIEAWLKKVTGMQLNKAQTLEHVGLEAWQAAYDTVKQGGGTLIDKQILTDWREHEPVPRIARESGESLNKRRREQDRWRTLAGERPTFQPPDLEYLDRYLPLDTQAVIGLDARQIIASPLAWELLSSYTSWAPSPEALKKLFKETSFDRSFDVHYVLLAMPQGKFKLDDPSDLAALTVVARGTFDRVKLREQLNAVAEQNKARMTMNELGKDRWYLTVRTEPNPGYLTLVENHTLIASGDEKLVKRFFYSSERRRLNGEFRKYLAGVNREQSLWFAARGDVLHPSSLPTTPRVVQKLPESRSFLDSLKGIFWDSLTSAATIKQRLAYGLRDLQSIHGGVVFFADMDFHVRASFSKEASASLYSSLGQTYKQLIIGRLLAEVANVKPDEEFWSSVKIELKADGRELLLDGKALPDAISSLIDP